MKLKNYNLNVKNKTLLENVSVEFIEGEINHILGKNGVGKSTFAKDLYNRFDLCIIGSYSNLPLCWKVKDLIDTLKNVYNEEVVDKYLEKLGCFDINVNLMIKDLSDGQKQKLKIISFLLDSKDTVIFDELTNALDKKTVNQIYDFIQESDSVKTIVNITHNISDLKNLPGNYYYMDDYDIVKVDSREKIIDMYIEG